MVMADGSVVECDATHEAELFQAARLGLGAFGIVTELRMGARPAYRLKERMWAEAADRVLDGLDALIAETRHFEFFWLPGRNKVACKSLAETDEPARHPLGPEGGRLSWSDRVLANERNDKHTEMEYSLPAEHGVACFRALRARIEADFPELAWPIELRTLAADDVWMSTAFDRETITLSVHQGADQPHEALFAACEAVFRAFDGRPHWGKAHDRRGADLASLHPRWHAWWAERDRRDPRGRFLNAHLRALRGDG
jgi:FAD/FMN-containing dehydrogenase